MKEKNTVTDNAEKIASDFNSFCWTVIRRSVINQLRGYVRHCRNYGTVSLEETEESLLAVYDDIPAGKIKISAGRMVILLEDERLADALMELQDKKREIILLSAAFGYSLSEIAGQLDLKYDTVKRYKSNAMRELRGKVGKDAKKK
ncbi:MAG: sigma-70 family RNA polymerase sigma factor [Lachnospiraceae bacterium]|nr:sigma-70 family RNA polymerase sigma factor [Lachnospiraceae bacterium]